MKKSNRNLVGVAVVSLILGLASPFAAFAATAPTLGAAESFSVLGATSVTSTGLTNVSGDLGVSPGTSITDSGTLTVGGVTHNNDATAILAHTAAVNANGFMLGQGSPTVISPALDGQTLTPGVYDFGSGLLSGGVLHLNGQGIYILRASSDLTSSGSIDLQNGARACDVYWDVQTLATINGTSFIGTIVAGTGIHFNTSGTSLNGRALAFGGNVTMIGNHVTGPTCAPVPVPATPSNTRREGTINVVKVVVNDGGGTKTVSDFPLFVNGVLVVSGVTNTFPAPAAMYAVTETSDAHYLRTFSGDCDVNGDLNLNPGDNKFCIITNNDIAAPVVSPVPPLIDLVKVPSPLALPNGPGPVTYTYTLKNVGTVPMTNITLVGDTCSPIINPTGDTNNDSKLDLNEIWVYHCTTTLSSTHTNTVVATGWANGISAVDIASATVVVGVPIVPPLIHVTKIPNPIALSAAGGNVVYSYAVTTPGTVALHNVVVADDVCKPVAGPYGDTNKNNLLDSGETWSYACESKLTKTTTNTVVATGEANGLTARDFSIVTVIVASPKLPNTGYAPAENSPWFVFGAGIFAVLISLYIIRRKQTN